MSTRWLWIALALLISLWVLFPIYIIALSAFSDEAEISAWPKAFLPAHFSLENPAYGIVDDKRHAPTHGNGSYGPQHSH